MNAVTSDLAVSRLSVQTLSQAESIVAKLIEYEKSPNPLQISDTILLCRNELSKTADGKKSDVQNDGEWLYKLRIKPYWDGRVMLFYNTFTDFEGGADYDVTPIHLQEQLSKGYLLVDESSHGWISQWGGS